MSSSKKENIPLSVSHPELCEEWDLIKNAPLTPSDFSYGSSKKVWWCCKKCGHSWPAYIENRAKNGTGCPVCTNRTVVKGKNDFGTLYPELLSEWDYQENASISPYSLSSGSCIKVNWICKYGHKWKASIKSRVNGHGCKLCSHIGSSMVEQGIAFYLKQVGMVEQRYRIDGREVDIFLPDYKVGIEYDGSYFHKSESKKSLDKSKETTLRDNGVFLIRIVEHKDQIDNSVISGQSVIISYTYDNLGKNYDWVLHSLCDFLTKHTGNILFNQIDIDLERDRLKIREQFDLYFKENSLAVKNPELANQWHPTKNGLLTPEMFLPNSTERVYWWCNKCGQEWKDSINHRNTKSGKCPYCTGKRVIQGKTDLLSINPELASEWDFVNNKGLQDGLGNDISTPDKVLPLSSQEVFWIGKCGHHWPAVIASRTRGSGCPYCCGQKVLTGYNDLQTKYPDIAKEWHPTKNQELKPTEVVSGSNQKVWWKCSVCGYEYRKEIVVRTSQNQGCRICGKEKQRKSQYIKVQKIETGEVFSSIKEAAERVNVDPSMITMCCKGYRKTAKGFHWRYFDE